MCHGRIIGIRLKPIRAVHEMYREPEKALAPAAEAALPRTALAGAVAWSVHLVFG